MAEHAGTRTIDTLRLQRTRASLLVISFTSAATVVVNFATELWWSFAASCLVVAACIASELWIRSGKRARLDVIGTVVVAVSVLSISIATLSEVPSKSFSPFYFLLLVPGASNMLGQSAARLSSPTA